MNVNLLTALIGIAAGAVGYWFVTFQMQPVLRFLEVRNKIFSDFIYYAQVINAEGLNDEMQALYRERVLANRQSSAQLRSAYLQLPWWYKNSLSRKGLDPETAARNLIGFSNTTDYQDSHRIEQEIRERLGLPAGA